MLLTPKEPPFSLSLVHLRHRHRHTSWRLQKRPSQQDEVPRLAPCGPSPPPLPSPSSAATKANPEAGTTPSSRTVPRRRPSAAVCSLHILVATESNGGGFGGGTGTSAWHHPNDGLPHTLEHLVFLGILSVRASAEIGGRRAHHGSPGGRVRRFREQVEERHLVHVGGLHAFRHEVRRRVHELDVSRR